MDTPRARSPRPLPPLPSKPTAAPLPPRPPAPPLSAATSPSHDLPFGGQPRALSMSRTPVVGRVGSDLSHNNYAKASRHPTTTSHGTGCKNHRNRAKTTGGGNKPAEEKKVKDKAKKRGLDVGQWVKKRMATMVEQLRASFSRQAAERERREQRRRPHSFSGHGPNAAKERERWTRRRTTQLSSAPASLRVSPANSGHLSVGSSVKVSTSSEESTMEELQSAIEAAIAHCKNSNSRGQQQQADGGGRRGDTTKLQ